MTLSSIASANIGPAIVIQFSIHLMVLTWIVGIGESILLCTLFRAWRLNSATSRIFISMITANFASALLGSLFVNSGVAARIMGDVTIENLIPAFWTMVYVTFVLTMIIEFPFFLVALYGRKWLIPKAVAATLFLHCISYSLLFFFYTGAEFMNMVTELKVVPAMMFEMKEDYDLYYISPDGNHVLKSDLAGNGTKVIATLVINGVPERLCACPRKVIKETKEGTDKEYHETIKRVCWESGFDLFVVMGLKGEYFKKMLLENFSPSSAVNGWDGGYYELRGLDNYGDFGPFRTFIGEKKWEFSSGNWGPLRTTRFGRGSQAYTTRKTYEDAWITDYRILTPFVQWPVRNGTHIAGDYAVFLLGKDQICILDPEKKRIALIARGFGPVVAKPPLEGIPEKTPEETNEQTVNEAP